MWTSPPFQTPIDACMLSCTETLHRTWYKIDSHKLPGCLWKTLSEQPCTQRLWVPGLTCFVSMSRFERASFFKDLGRHMEPDAESYIYIQTCSQTCQFWCFHVGFGSCTSFLVLAHCLQKTCRWLDWLLHCRQYRSVMVSCCHVSFGGQSLSAQSLSSSLQGS